MSGAATPLWRWLAVGGICAFAAVYFLVTGEIAIDKQHTMTITRALHPAGYWLTVVTLVALAVLTLRKAWQRVHSE